MKSVYIDVSRFDEETHRILYDIIKDSASDIAHSFSPDVTIMCFLGLTDDGTLIYSSSPESFDPLDPEDDTKALELSAGAFIKSLYSMLMEAVR